MDNLGRSDDPSGAALNVLRDASAPDAEREEAFERLLQLPDGWWGDRPLLLFVSAYALATARVVARQQNLSPDSIDWESIAMESLLVFYRGAPGIRSSPAPWLRSVIRHRVLDEIRHYYLDLHAKRVSDHHVSHESFSDLQAGEEDARENETTTSADRLIAAVQTLPPSLRTVAQLLFIDRCTRHEIASVLGLSQAALRQRIRRLALRLTAELQRVKLAKPKVPKGRA